jgi:TRAP-type C4-dicarboxylate transport system substrate-binding protein
MTGKRLLFSAAALCASLVAATASAQQISWRLNNNFAQPRQETQLLNGFANEINRRTPGRLQVTVHDGGAMNLRDADILRWMDAGGAEIGVLSASFVGRDAPELNAVYIQGSIGSREQHERALPELEAIYREIVQRWNLVPVTFMRFPVFDASIFCRRDVINSLAQLRGRKLRVWSRDLVETFTRLGVAAQIVPQNEVYAAMQTGVIDCTLYPARLAPTISLHEVARHASYLFPVAATPYVIVVHRRRWEALPQDLRDAVSEAGRWLYQESQKYEHDSAAEQAARARLAQGGVQWLEPYPDADRAAFMQSAAESWAQLAREAGGQAAAYRERVQRAIGNAPSR